MKFLHVVICILLDIHWSYKNMLFWAGIVRHRLSFNQIVRCFKRNKLENYTRYQVDHAIKIKICDLGLWLQNTLGQSVCRIFYFWLVWLVNLDTGGPLLHCTCLSCFSIFLLLCLRDLVNYVFVSFLHDSGGPWILKSTLYLSKIKEPNMGPKI